MPYRGFAEEWRQSLAENSAMWHAMAHQQQTILLLQEEVDRLLHILQFRKELEDEKAKKIIQLQKEVDDLNKELVSLREQWNVNAVAHPDLRS